MDNKEALITKIYASYMNKKDHFDPNALDAISRSPELIRNLLEGLNVRDNNMNNIIVTGSKGKGSVCKILTKLFSDNGLRVGTMISPHQVAHNERIKINGQDITDQDFMTLAAPLPNLLDQLDGQLPDNKYISPMASWAALSLKHFQNNSTDINILECGRGGKHDDLNFISSQVSVVNTIFLEHTQQLGDSVALITDEKLGIIKDKTNLAFLGNQEDSLVVTKFDAQCECTHTPGALYGRDFGCKNISIHKNHTTFDLYVKDRVYHGIQVPTISTYLLYNIALAVAVSADFIPPLTALSISNSLAEMDWGGYTEIIGTHPTILVDGCINRACAKYISAYVRANNFNRVTAFVGIPTSKDYEGVVDEFQEITSRIIITQPKHTHHSFSKEQANKITPSKLGATIEYSENFSASYDSILTDSTPRDLVIITGIQGFVGETKAYIKRIKK